MAVKTVLACARRARQTVGIDDKAFPMNDRTTRIAFFLCGFAAFLNLYSTQG
ncbi:MFS transporter, partial [Escherichia coli]|nr:MFS transporter [Escherichia coli]